MFKNDTKHLGFNDFWFIIFGVIALGFVIPQIFFGVNITTQGFSYHYEWFEAILYATAYWFINRWIMIHLRKKYPSFELVQRRLIWSLIYCILAISIANVILTPLISNIFNLLNVERGVRPTAVQGFGASYGSTFFILAIYESIWYYSQLKKSIQESERVKIAHVATQLDGLRNQVNPHFLFNSLNTLNHIVEHEEKAEAKNFINKLSTVYRYILDSREDSTIELEQELEFVEAYIMIQKERFLENLKVEIKIPKSYFYKKIIPLSLQLLVENAIKHNIISTKKPLSISIEIDELNNMIVVSNNLQKKSKVLHSTKVGLENIKERYGLLTDEKFVKIEETESQFRVFLPLLN